MYIYIILYILNYIDMFVYCTTLVYNNPYMARSLICGELGTNQVPLGREHILQLECVLEDDAISLTCSTLVGEEKVHIRNAQRFDLLWDIQKRIARELKIGVQSLRIVLPDGRLLTSACQANPVVTVGDVSRESPKRRRLA